MISAAGSEPLFDCADSVAVSDNEDFHVLKCPTNSSGRGENADGIYFPGLSQESAKPPCKYPLCHYLFLNFA